MSGSLQKVLQCFSKHDMNMTHIESRPSKGSENRYHFNVDFDGKKDAMKPLLLALDEHCVSVLKLDAKNVPWFPRKISDLDKSVGQVEEVTRQDVEMLRTFDTIDLHIDISCWQRFTIRSSRIQSKYLDC